RCECVDRLDTGLQWLRHRLAGDDTWCDLFCFIKRFFFDTTLTIDWRTKRIDHASEEMFAYRHLEYLAGTRDGVAFFDSLVVTEDNHTETVCFEVQGNTC